MAEPYCRTGRGGAGNFYSQKTIEQATATASQQSPSDLEAQKPLDDSPPSDPANPPQDLPSTTSSTPAGAWARSGRGGAGNFVDPPSAAAAAAAIQQLSAPNPAMVHSTGVPNPGARASGRGGAGNFNSSYGGEQKLYNEEQEQKRKAALDAKVFEDVKAGLQAPGRVYHMHGHGHGSGKEIEELGV